MGKNFSVAVRIGCAPQAVQRSSDREQYAVAVTKKTKETKQDQTIVAELIEFEYIFHCCCLLNLNFPSPSS